jgi:hypothetical protein
MFKEILTISSLTLGGAAVVAAVTIQNDPRAITRSNGDLQPSASEAVHRPPLLVRDFTLRTTTGAQIPENDAFVITGRPPARL